MLKTRVIPLLLVLLFRASGQSHDDQRDLPGQGRERPAQDGQGESTPADARRRPGDDPPLGETAATASDRSPPSRPPPGSPRERAGRTICSGPPHP